MGGSPRAIAKGRWQEQAATIPGSNGSGAIIKVVGITGRIRGMKHKRADGQTVRPSLVGLDGMGSRVERVSFGWCRGQVTG